MKSETSRKYLLVFSAIVIGYLFFGVDLDGAIPYTKIKFNSSEHVPLVLTALIIFFSSHYLYYWFKKKKEERNLFELITSIPIAFVAVSTVFYSYLLKIGIDWKVIIFSILLLFLGLILSIAIDFTITSFFSLRSKEEMEELGLGRVPSASKAFIRSLFYLYPLSISIMLFFSFYSEKLPTPLNNYWLFIFLTPTFMLNMDFFYNIIKLLGPKKVRKNALKNLRFFQHAFDLHEMHYQYSGIEEFKQYEVPPLCLNAKYGELKEVQALLNNGDNPNIQDKRGWTPLMWASAEGHLDVVDLLLEYGADPNIVNYLSRSSIMYASKYGSYNIAKALIDNGAIINTSDEFCNHPSLAVASQNGHLNIVQLLVENGADIMYKNKNGVTAIEIAMESGYGEVAKYLRNCMRKEEQDLSKKSNVIDNTDWISSNKQD